MGVYRTADGLVFLGENLPPKQDEYNRFLRRILERSDILDAEAITGIRGLVVDLQERIVSRIRRELSRGEAYHAVDGKLKNWGLWWIPRLIRSVDDVVKKVAADAGAKLGEYLKQSWDLGADLVDGTIEKVTGLRVMSPRLDRFALTTIAPFSAQLITAIDEETRSRIDKAIKVNVALGESPSVLMDKLEADLEGKPSPFRSVALRAENVTRTEVARLQNLGREARMRAAVNEYPELTRGPNALKLKFISVKRAPWPCKVCEPLDGQVFEYDDADRPNPPLHPQCRCVLAPVFEGVTGVSPPRRPMERQEKAKLSECWCCG